MKNYQEEVQKIKILFGSGLFLLALPFILMLMIACLYILWIILTSMF
jgi:hypothetical protein